MSKQKLVTVTAFALAVYDLMLKVPRGKVTNYTNIAIALGKPRSFRAVGNALHRNPFAPQVPCHRVIRSDGSLGGFAGGSNKKYKLLKQEGVVIKDGKIEQSFFYGF